MGLAYKIYRLIAVYEMVINMSGQTTTVEPATICHDVAISIRSETNLMLWFKHDATT